MDTSTRKKRIITAVILAAAALLIAFAAVWTIKILNPAQPSKRASDVLEQALSGSGPVSAAVDEEGNITFLPAEKTDTGIIFYPGALVDNRAYSPLCQKLAEKGFFTVICKADLNISLLDIDDADKVIADNPDIKHWYIGGHSMGGVASAFYAEKNCDRLDGMILLASFSTADLTGSDLPVMLVCASDDGILRTDKYEKNKVNLPAGYTEAKIDGGCHAYFGDYGEQRGDGKPSITNEIQQEIAVSDIKSFITENTDRAA